MDTVTTHGCPAAAALGKPCGRFVIGAGGVFSAATDAEIAARIDPYRAVGGLTVTVSMDLDMSAVLDGSVDNGIAVHGFAPPPRPTPSVPPHPSIRDIPSLPSISSLPTLPFTPPSPLTVPFTVIARQHRH